MNTDDEKEPSSRRGAGFFVTIPFGVFVEIWKWARGKYEYFKRTRRRIR